MVRPQKRLRIRDEKGEGIGNRCTPRAWRRLLRLGNGQSRRRDGVGQPHLNGSGDERVAAPLGGLRRRATVSAQQQPTEGGESERKRVLWLGGRFAIHLSRR